MKKFRLFFFLVLPITVACVGLGETDNSDSAQLRLCWYKSYPKENWDMVREGLRWTLSYLGATLPRGSFDQVVSVTDSMPFEVDFKQLGFTNDALDVLGQLCDSIRRTPGYATQNALDIGRFVALTIGSSWHYYRITGIAPTLQEFITHHHLENPLRFGVTRSTVSEHHRRIEFNSDTAAILKAGFLAVEGSGDLRNNSFLSQVYEVFDIMPNGQLRFGVYDAQGKLMVSSPRELSKAGKPAKCLWCHEIEITPLFVNNEAVPGMLTDAEFHAWQSAFQRNLTQYRVSLNDDLPYENRQDHTYMELLYIGFMEPSLMRLTAEWGMDSLTVQAKMQHLPQHIYEEFPYMGNLWCRFSADSSMNFKNPEVSRSIREELGQEKNYLR
jgi:hypothetical protein